MTWTGSDTSSPVEGIPVGPRCGRPAVWAVCFLFFLSGLTSLIYEVIWVREFGRVFGVTTYAVSTVLAAFFAGLAIGSYATGRIIDRTQTHPLILYGVMEGIIGGYALLLPLLLGFVEGSYPSLYARFSENFALFTLFRFVVCFLLLVAPTTLMGATLPVLARLLVDREARLGFHVGRLYAINTLGAVAATVGAGFVFLPLLGVPGTTRLAACGNFVLAAGALALSRVAGFRPSGQAAPAAASAGLQRLKGADAVVLLLAFVSGLTMLALEVVWTRALILILGSTTYAFSLMLTAVLVGVASGSAVFARFADSARHRAALVGVLFFLGGACAALGPALVNRLPFIFLRLYDWAAGDWRAIMAAQFSVCFLLVFLPTFLSGAGFPILVRMYSRGEARVGRTVAQVYAVNTLGGIIGSLLGGFVLVRYLGLQPALTAAALTLMLGGGVPAVLRANEWRGELRATVAAAMLAAVAVLGFVHPRFDVKLLFAGWGPFAGGSSLGRTGGSTVDVADRHMERLLYHQEGVSASVDVLETAWGDRILSINAQPVASTYLYDLRLLKLLGHLPVLLHPDPREVLIIGLGAGVAGGVMAGYPAVSEVTIVELSEEVPGAAAQFSDWNFDVLDNPKVRIVLNDGANYVKAVRNQYDIIGSDPIHPFLMGNGILYSLEHWRTCRERLREGGILVQWLPLYQLSAEDFATVVRTFAEAFPNATLWFAGTDVALLGVKGNYAIDFARMGDHLAHPAMRADLLTLGISQPADVMGLLVSGPEQLRRIGAEGRVNRVDYPVLEFTAPKGILLRGVSATMPLLIDAVARTPNSAFRALVEPMLAQPLEESAFTEMTRARRAQLALMRGLLHYSNGDYRQYLESAKQAQALRKRDQFLKQALADAQVYAAWQQAAGGFVRTAYNLYREAAANDPGRVDAITGAVLAAVEGGDPAAAEEALALAIPRHEYAFQVLACQGVLALGRKDYPTAQAALELSAAHGQESPLVLACRGILAWQDSRPDTARTLFERALDISAKPADTLYEIVKLCAAHEFDRAALHYAPQLLKAATEAIAANPELPSYYNYRALAYTLLGEATNARRDQQTARTLLKQDTGSLTK